MKKFFAFVAAAMTALTMNARQLTVAQAIEEGMKLDSMATSTVIDTIEGYVLNPTSFSLFYNNQSWEMADDATNTAKQVFKGYNCCLVNDKDTVRILHGDKVKLIGKLKKYKGKKDTQFTIEIEKGYAIPSVLAEGDRTIDRTIHEITLDSALTLGNELANGDQTPIQYAFEGFVVGMINDKNNTYSDGGYASYGNQSLWIASAADGAADKEHAFEIYQGIGKANGEKVEMKVGHKIRIVCQIKNYGGVIENADTKLPVEVLNYVKEEIDTITVAEAVEIALALENNKETEKKYAVLGYVKKIKDYNTDYKNQEFYIVDDLSNTTAADVNCYRTSIATPGCVEGDRVIVVGKLMNNYYKEKDTNNAQIKNGEAKILWHAGIEEVTLTTKAQKVMVDGVVYIIRDNKMFDLMGNQVR